MDENTRRTLEDEAAALTIWMESGDWVSADKTDAFLAGYRIGKRNYLPGHQPSPDPD